MVSVSVPNVVQKQPIQPTMHQQVQTPLQPVTVKHVKQTPKKRPTQKIVLVSLISVIAATAIFANVFYVYQNKKIQSNIVTQVLGESNDPDSAVTSSSSDVDESDVPPSTVSSYRVAADLPRTIEIDSIDVYARVIRVGIGQDNEIQAPKSIYNAGWYEGSNKPNEPGAVFIDGHVSGPTKKGIFYNLHKVAVGEVVSIELGSGEKVSYKVEAKEYVKPNEYDMNKALRSYNPDRQGLNIMTCTGDFNQNSGQYEERLVVYTTRI
jgi:LPXTG-site transpeptidase (sortase) family protein